MVQNPYAVLMKTACTVALAYSPFPSAGAGLVSSVVNVIELSVVTTLATVFATNSVVNSSGAEPVLYHSLLCNYSTPGVNTVNNPDVVMANALKFESDVTLL